MPQSREGHQDPFADNSPSPSRPHSPHTSPIPSNPLAYQQVSQGSSPNVSADSPGLSDGRGSRFVSSPLNPRQSSSPGGSRTRPTSPTSSSGHGKVTDRAVSPNSSSSHAEKDFGMRGVMAGTVGGGFSPYPVSVKEKIAFRRYVYSLSSPLPLLVDEHLLVVSAGAGWAPVALSTICHWPHHLSIVSPVDPVSGLFSPSLAIRNMLRPHPSFSLSRTTQTRAPCSFQLTRMELTNV
jgi:hypothetical protein